ncbi:nitrate reductase [Pseudomonas sp. Pc102]|nr:nitrate reductase [Pseudomonas sp. Pc102]
MEPHAQPPRCTLRGPVLPVAYENPLPHLQRWLRGDGQRLLALRCVASLGLRDAWLAAGFVRNLAWDRLHGYRDTTPLADLDLIHFDPDDLDPETDLRIEHTLRGMTGHLPWSVKNQARMHLRNGDDPYRDSRDAMSHWPEVQTAIGVRLRPGGGIEIITPFIQSGLLDLRVTPNPLHPRQEAFSERLREKGWLQRWPRLQVDTAPLGCLLHSSHFDDA